MERPDAMNLKAALKRLEGVNDKPGVGLQRRFKRFEVRGEARLWPGESSTTPSPPDTVQVRDISRGGVGLLSNEPVSRGCFWQLELIDGGLSVRTLPAFCRYCREISDGAFLIGVEFGVEASVMLALGVPAKELAAGDQAENMRPLTGEFVDPNALLESDAA